MLRKNHVLVALGDNKAMTLIVIQNNKLNIITCSVSNRKLNWRFFLRRSLGMTIKLIMTSSYACGV